jgi:hypothetical protein
VPFWLTAPNGGCANGLLTEVTSGKPLAAARAFWTCACCDEMPPGALKATVTLVPAAVGTFSWRASLASCDWVPGSVKVFDSSPPATTLAAIAPTTITTHARITYR